MKSRIKLTTAAKHRIIFRSVFLSAFAAGMPYPVLGQGLHYYDPDALKGLPSIAIDSETYVFADIDNDGDKDAFNKNVFFENIGSSVEPDYQKRVGSLNPLSNLPAVKPEFVDIDADGDLDVFIGSIKEELSNDQNIRWYENTGSSTVAEYIEKDTSSLGDLYQNDAQRLTFVDIDADGDQDAFLNRGGQLRMEGFYENTGTSSSPFFTRTLSSNMSAINTLMETSSNLPIFIDIDGDDDLDALYSNNNNLIYLENTGSIKNPVFISSTVETSFYDKFSGENVQWQAIDIDNDTQIDLVINGTVIANNGLNGFNAFDFKRFKIPLGLPFADLDGDTDLDAFWVTQESDKYSLQQFTNEGGMYFFTDSVSWAGENNLYSGPHQARFIDLDQDGDIDQLVSINHSLDFYKNIGPVGLPIMEKQLDAENPFSSVNLMSGFIPKPIFVDIDDDGDYDFFTLDTLHESSGPISSVNNYLFSKKEIVFYENIGNASSAVYQRELSENRLVPTISGVISFAFSDVDYDGDQDLLLSDGQLIFFENKGDKKTPDFVLTDIATSPFKDISRPNIIAQLKFLDLDQNNYDDLIVNDKLLYLSYNPQDSDSDGLPNEWEILHAFDPDNGNDALLDSDNDGHTNREEFHADTDPRDPLEYPGSSTLDICQSATPASTIIIDSQHFNHTDNVTCTAAHFIILEGDVLFSSGTRGHFSAPTIHLKPNMTIPYGATVIFTSQGVGN